MNFVSYMVRIITRAATYYRQYGLHYTLSAARTKLRRIWSEAGSSLISKQKSLQTSIATKRPLVSVIIASYNHAEFVGAAVTSVLQQDMRDIEVIVIDDGSDDATPDIVAGIKDPRIRLFRLGQNRRIHPRNMGLRLARGRYAAFQNSDDQWAPDKLISQIQVLETNRNVVACFTDAEIIGENGERLTGTWANGLFSTENRTNSNWLRDFFDIGNCLCFPSAVVRLSETKSVGGFCESLIMLSDLDLWVRLASIGDFHIIDRQLTRNRVISGRNVSTPTPRALRRSRMEYSEVLWRYTEDPVISRVPEAFIDALPQGTFAVSTLSAGLATHALRLGSPAHRIFADRVLARLLGNHESRRKVLNIYGVELMHTFIRNRGELEVVINCGE